MDGGMAIAIVAGVMVALVCIEGIIQDALDRHAIASLPIGGTHDIGTLCTRTADAQP